MKVTVKKLSLKITPPEKMFSRCRRCPLHLEGCQTNCMPGRGSPKGIMFIGEAPGRNEDIEGLPFVGKSGQLLNAFIADARLNEHPVYITNVARCRPKDNRTPKIPTEARVCAEAWLVPEIKRVQPKVIVALGSVPFQTLTGKQQLWKQLGRVFETEYAPGVPVLPCLHPATILHHRWGKKITPRIIQRAMQRVMEQAWGLLNKHKQEITWEEVPAIPPSVPLGVDIEASGLEPTAPDFRITCASVAFSLAPNHYGVKFYPRTNSEFVTTLCRASEIVGHNLRYDLRCLRMIDKKISRVPTMDTILLAGLAEPGYPVMSLEHLAVTRLGVEAWKEETKDTDFSVLTPELKRRNLRDAVYTLALRQGPFAKTAKRAINAYVNNEVLKCSIRMTERGLPIDAREVARQKDKAEQTAGSLYSKLVKLVPNPASSQMVGKYLEPLIDKHGLPKSLTPTGKLKTDETSFTELIQVAETLNLGETEPIQFLRKLGTWKKVTKQIGTYLNTLAAWSPLARPDIFLVPYDGRGTVTGRITMELIQTFPRDGEIKHCIVSATRGNILVADYKQLELLITAILANEKKMLRMLDEEIDLHCFTAEKIFGRTVTKTDDYERQVGKRTNFATIYDVTPKGLRDQLWFKDEVRITMQIAERAVTGFFALFPGFRPYHESIRKYVQQHRRIVSPTGRILETTDERQAINMPSQGGGSDLNTVAMVLLDKAGWKPMINQYDSTACDIGDADPQEAENEIRHIMCVEAPKELERRFGWHFPVLPRVDIKVGPTWQ